MAYLLLIAIGVLLLIGFLNRLERADSTTIVAVIKATILAVLVSMGTLFLLIGRVNLAILCLLLLVVIYGRDVKRWFEKRARSRILSPPMDVDEAREILGVGEDATKDEILKAYRKLIAKNHPDKGGTPHMARKLTEARDLLLKELGE